MRRYHIQDRDDYKKYNKLCGMVTKVTNTIRKLDPQDPCQDRDDRPTPRQVISSSLYIA